MGFVRFTGGRAVRAQMGCAAPAACSRTAVMPLTVESAEARDWSADQLEVLLAGLVDPQDASSPSQILQSAMQGACVNTDLLRFC